MSRLGGHRWVTHTRARCTSPPGVRDPNPLPSRGDLHHLRPHDLQHGGAGEGERASVGAAGLPWCLVGRVGHTPAVL